MDIWRIEGENFFGWKGRECGRDRWLERRGNIGIYGGKKDKLRRGRRMKWGNCEMKRGWKNETIKEEREESREGGIDEGKE